MCGIVGGISTRNVTPILLEGLRRLEYRGYDSAGIALIDDALSLRCIRSVGKVSVLESAVTLESPEGTIGIAHTRWATHGKPTEDNAHPHVSRNQVALVHNGIIENFETLRSLYRDSGYAFSSETDTEVIVHCVHHYLSETKSLLSAVQKASRLLEGAYAIAAVSTQDPHRIVAARKGSPLVIGIGNNEHYIASDILALLQVCQQFIYLEEGDIADITRENISIYNQQGRLVTRAVQQFNLRHEVTEKGDYRHYMQKEIFEQPHAIQETLEGRGSKQGFFDNAFGTDAEALFNQVKSIHIVACGTSYHAGLVAKQWFESLAGLFCSVEIASEYRYHHLPVPEGCLLVTLSQSGETADTLAALRLAKTRPYVGTLAICNVPQSSLVRESHLVWMMRVGPEVGVASTKAFTAQLTALLILAMLIGKRHGFSQTDLLKLSAEILKLPEAMREILALDLPIEKMAAEFVEKEHALFLGRGIFYPIALEGALKLKEISYIHAEAYPAGELKHGPLALVDKAMPVVALAPQNEILDKLKSNLQEVSARGGQLYVFAAQRSHIESDEQTRVIEIPECSAWTAPILYSIPLQLLAYHVAVLKGTDVDQPRNLAKSVTVE